MVFEVSDDSISETSIPFLDVKVILENGKLLSDLYIKPTDKFQYLDFRSCHPHHQKANLPYALALRIRRICSNTADFKDHCDKLSARLRSRGYKMGLIKDGIRKASGIPRAEALRPSHQQQQQDRVIFSTTYNPMLPNIKERLNALEPILDASERCRQVFKEPPIIAYRRNRSLNDIIVNRRLPPDTQVASQVNITIDKTSNICEICKRTFASGKGKMSHIALTHRKKANQQQQQKPQGFHKCNDKRCHLCHHNINGTFGSTINITSTGQVFNIKQHMTCKSHNIIYCITCTKCKDQYIGETEQELHDRSTSHLCDIRKNKSGLPYVTHFQGCGIEHYSIIGVEQLRREDARVRKQREIYYKNLFQVRIK